MEMILNYEYYSDYIDNVNSNQMLLNYWMLPKDVDYDKVPHEEGTSLASKKESWDWFSQCSWTLYSVYRGESKFFGQSASQSGIK